MNDKVIELYSSTMYKEPRTIGDIHYEYLERLERIKKKNQQIKRRIKKGLMFIENSNDEN